MFYFKRKLVHTLFFDLNKSNNKETVPGQKISYRDLAERLSMSPTPVVQALKWLEFQGLVEHIPNRGYYTSPFSLQEVRENFEVRKLIELALLPASIKQLDQKGDLGSYFKIKRTGSWKPGKNYGCSKNKRHIKPARMIMDCNPEKPLSGGDKTGVGLAF